MAARVFLLGILFTEVLEPICCAGGNRGIGNNLSSKNGSKKEGFMLNLNKNPIQSLQIEPGGYAILGNKGITLKCLTNNIYNVTWLYNNEPAPPCGIPRCNRLDNDSIHLYKIPSIKSAVKTNKWNKTNYFDQSKKHEYRCIGQTSSGGYLRSAPTYIQIAELAHAFRRPPIDVIVHEGDIARLFCLIDSIPFPSNIKWQHNGKPVYSDRNNTKYFMVPPGVLYITATKQSDAGSYRCIATNTFIKKTKKSKEAQLTVISRLTGNEPKIIASLLPQVSYNHTLIKGSNLTLVCAVSGSPLSIVKWLFISQANNKVSSTQPQILLNSTTGISILTLKNINISQAGIYLCSTENIVNGVMEFQNITVDVVVPPIFIKKPIDLNCPNGRTARFECQAQGIPNPKIYWLKDAKNVTINGRSTVYYKENNKVELAIAATVPSDSGDYQCVAINSAGEIWSAARLQINASKNSPPVPTSLRCYASSPLKISISWIPPKSMTPGSIKAYTVHYSPAEGGKEEVSPEPGNSTTVEVSKLLEPYTNYSFYVRVWSSHGASDQSATIVCATAPSVPKTAPKVYIDVLSSTKINITWQPLTKKEARGVVVEYKIQWRLHDQPSSRVVFVPANIEYHILDDLLPGAQYDLRVLARTEQGWPNMTEGYFGWTTVLMPTSDSINYKIRNSLDIEVININASHLKIKWKIKENEKHEILEFDSWQIYCENFNGDKLFTVLLDKNSTEYLFSNLEPNISYTVGLCIVINGISSDCILKIVKSNQYKSNNMFMTLEAIPLSPTSIQITWAMINKTSLDIFEVCYQPVHYVNNNSSKCFYTNDTKAIIGDLRAFTLYRFKLKLIKNDTNVNNKTYESIECYTNEDVPGKPEEVEGFQDGPKIRVVWKKPSIINGIIIKYFVSYYSSDSTESPMTWGNMTVPGNKTFAVLPELPLGERYYIKVYAATRVGYGQPSNPILVFTKINLSKSSTSSDKQEPPIKSKPDQSLGIILGVGISMGFITISLCTIYCRKKWEHFRSLRESTQPFKMHIFSRQNNTCFSYESSTSASQQINNQISCNEIELAVLCPSSPTSTNPQSDSKGVLLNGMESGAKQPLLSFSNMNDKNRDQEITKNIQYQKQDDSVLEKRLELETDLNNTNLTLINCTSIESTSSLNNNFDCSASPMISLSTILPVTQING